MTDPNHPRLLAALHAQCFDRPRPWNEDEFKDLLPSPGVFLLQAPEAFLLGRCLVGEAELLTLAVAPGARRQGIGRRLVAAFAEEARRQGAIEAFLEVAQDNDAARRLYLAQGWQEAGLRRRYYGPATDAVVMRLTLRSRQDSG